jgi:hypothetical protein
MAPKKHAVLTIRMAPQLRDGLKASAEFAGCSLNAYVVQVLAAAAGQRARFRGTAETGPTPEEEQDELRMLDRLPSGTPVDWHEATRHRHAYQDWFLAAREANLTGIGRIVGHIERNCPWHYVEWKEFNAPLLPADLERERLHDVS